MIGILFQKGTDLIEVIVEGTEVTFGSVKGQCIKFSKIDGLKLDYNGIIKEFPDLDGKTYEEARTEAIRRFKEKVKFMKNEESRARYVVAELKNSGYVPKKIIRNGFRTMEIKNGMGI